MGKVLTILWCLWCYAALTHMLLQGFGSRVQWYESRCRMLQWRSILFLSIPVAIQDLGNPGWNWEELLSAMKKEGFFSLLAHHMAQRLISLRTVRKSAADPRAETDYSGCSPVCQSRPSMARGLRAPKERILYAPPRDPWSTCGRLGVSRCRAKP